MTTALIIGDPHFKISNIRETTLMTASILNIAKERQPTFIVVLGDILDRHESVHVTPLTRATRFLADLKDIAPTYVLIGNHDLKNNKQFLSDEHPFVAVKKWKDNGHEVPEGQEGHDGVHKLTHPLYLIDTTTITTINNQVFTFVPYVPPSRFLEALNYVEGWKNSTCIFAHQEFKGCQMGALTSVEGDEWNVTYPLVISGHIHDYQKIGPNILYPGTPIQHTYGDRRDKSISLVKFHRDNEYSYSEERIPLGIPIKHIVRITCSEVATFSLDAFKNYELKIVISGTAAELKAIHNHPVITEWRKTGHLVTTKTVNDQNHQMDILEVQKYSSALWNRVQDNPSLRIQYEKLFGKK
jgi:DNA repair exonuclease SbcCD nuclease subunit